MIGYLEGIVKIIKDDFIVISTQGVGYKVFCPSTILQQTSAGDFTELHVETKVSENDITLFGFLTEQELELFKKLCSVHGIAGKGALAIIGHLGYDGFCSAVLSEDEKTVSSTKGIGAKTARKIIVDLKKHVEDTYEGGASPLDEGARNITILALENMGINRKQSSELISRVIKEKGPKINSENLIKACLQLLKAA